MCAPYDSHIPYANNAHYSKTEFNIEWLVSHSKFTKCSMKIPQLNRFDEVLGYIQRRLKVIAFVKLQFEKLTAVATKMGVVPDRNRRNAASRSGWVLSP